MFGKRKENERIDGMSKRIEESEQRIDMLFEDFFGKLKQLEVKISTIYDELAFLKAWIKQIERKIENEFILCKGEFNQKLVGIVKAVDVKIGTITAKDSDMIVNALKRIAELEQFKEVSENVKPIEQLILKRDTLKRSLLEKDRQDRPDLRLQGQIDILEWIIGEGNG